MLEKVGKTFLESFKVLSTQVCLSNAAVVLKASDSGNNDHRVGTKTGHTALDIQELLRAEVSAESCFCDSVIRKLHSHLCSSYRVASVSDVGERTAVYDRGHVFKRLYQIGLEGVLEKSCHSALSVQVACCDGLLLADFSVCIADDDPGESLLEVVDVAGKAKDCHDLGGNCDVIAVLAGRSVDSSAKTVHYEAKLTVVHVHASLPCDLAGIDIELISLIDVVVDHSCQQVVCGADRVEVTCEVEIDVLHGNDLRVSAAGRAALDSENRSEGGLAQCYHNLLAELLKTISQTDGCCCLSFSCGRRVHRCNKDQFAVFPVGILQKLIVDLSFIFAVLFQIFVTDACLCRDLGDRKHLTFLRNFDITLVSHSFLLNFVLIHCKRAVTVDLQYLLHYLSLPRRSTSSQFPVPMWCSTNPSVTENLYSTHMLLPNCNGSVNRSPPLF